jgi:uracil-DNA glycosylase
MEAGKSSMKTWATLDFWTTDTWRAIRDRLNKEKFYPGRDCVFRALHLTPLHRVKAVILGQDPYHNGLATGLAFSVNRTLENIPDNSSIKNILREYVSDTGFPMPRSGNLIAWASRGVLLLNTILTVEPDRPLSHSNWGWQSLAQEILETVKQHRPKAVFIGWGKEAQDLIGTLGDVPRVFSAHPSGRSANRGFFGSRPFTKANALLTSNKEEIIQWRLPS